MRVSVAPAGDDLEDEDAVAETSDFAEKMPCRAYSGDMYP